MQVRNGNRNKLGNGRVFTGHESIKSAGKVGKFAK